MRTILVLLLLSVSSAASAIVIRHDVDDSKYRVSAAEFPALVDLLGEGHGMLIAPRWVLTAAHALRYISVVEVKLNGLPRKVERVIVHPDYKELPQSMIDEALKDGDGSKVVQLIGSSADLALIKLAQPVADVAPALLYRGKDELGRIVKLIGRGATGTGVKGLKPHAPHRTALRRAYNTITTIDDRWLGYVFDKGPTAHKLEGMGGDGDSGGPLLIEIDDHWQLAGLVSWKLPEGDFRAFRAGLYGQTSFNVRLSRYVEWIETVMSSE
jgi:hypothetical protein